MKQQLQVANPNGAEPESPSAGTADRQPQAEQASAAAEVTLHGSMERLLSSCIWILFVFVIGLWVGLLGWGIYSTDLNWNCLSKLGNLGDSFGILNTLFSGLAFLGIIISIKLQRDDLKLQREELAMQRKEITFQRKAIEIQAQEAKHQSEEMESQRKLAQEYQDERFFVLLLEQVKGNKFLLGKEGISEVLDVCYDDRFRSPDSNKLARGPKAIQEKISQFYVSNHEISVIDEYNAIFIEFVVRIRSRNTKFQYFFDSVEHIHGFIKSISDMKIQENYAKIVYNCIDQYDRIIIFMYLVAKLKLRKGDILGDLLHGFYEIERDI